jgi:GT2 family glycosyltransferase
MTIAMAIPSLDQGRFLGEALASVLDQTGVDVRVAVVDGGSRDDSLAVIRRFERRLAYWRSNADRGQAAAINEGIARLGPVDYVGWLNADDLLLPQGLSRMAAHLDAHPECVAVFGRASIVDEHGSVIGEFPTRPFTRRALARTSIICQPASLMRRQDWDAVGGLDETLRMCLDYDLWWRLSKRGAIGFLPELVACSRDHEATKTRTDQDRLYEEAFAVLHRHLGHVPWRWCRNEAAYAWRRAHGGRRASGVASWFVCGHRAMSRYLRAAIGVAPADRL